MTGKRSGEPPEDKACAVEDAFIVSSAHLAAPGHEALSEFEFALTVVNHAFHRWIARAIAAAGLPDLSAIDTIILHSINHRAREKTISGLMFTLNFSERHYLNYAMKKLDGLGLITRRRQGKEVFVATSKKGAAVCEEYARIRRICLLDQMEKGGSEWSRDVAKAMRVMTGVYEQASRSASSL